MAIEKQKKICLIGASFSTNNLGVSALSEGAILSILHSHPNAELILLDYGKKSKKIVLVNDEGKIEISQINMRFSKRVLTKNHVVRLICTTLFYRLFKFQFIKKELIDKNIVLSTIYHADFLVSIAGGDSFSDIYGIKRFLYMSLPQFLIICMKKELILLPQTIGPFDNYFVRCFASYILTHASMVYSREKNGLIEMQNLLGSRFNADKFKFSYDVGFIIKPSRPKFLENYPYLLELTEISNLYGVNISGLLYMGGYNRNNMFNLRTDYKVLVDEIIGFFLHREDSKILLIPHNFGMLRNSESDFIACKKIYESKISYSKDRLYMIPEPCNQNEIKYFIGMCDFFVGARMHACIAALSQNVPAISIAYSKKFKGVMQSIGMESLVADPREADKETILNMIEKCFDIRVSIRQQLKESIPKVKEEIYNIFSDLN